MFTSSQALTCRPDLSTGRLALAAMLCLSAPAQGLGYAGYIVTDLGKPLLSEVTGINNRGQVIGNAVSNGGFTGIYTSNAWLYSAGAWGQLTPPAGFESFFASGINDSGAITGALASCASAFSCSQAFVFSNGVFTPLGVLVGNLPGTSAGAAINSAGTVAGNSQPAPGPWEYANGVVTQLIFPGSPESIVSGINANGVIAGTTFVSPPPMVDAPSTASAFVYDHGTVTSIGTLGHPALPVVSDSYANAINASGQVVGQSTSDSGDEHAFLYTNGTFTDLGTLGGRQSAATAVNVAGQAVGDSALSDGVHYSRFVYADGQIRDLASLIDPSTGDWAVLSVGGINDAGQIPVIACMPGDCHVLMLSPATTVVEYQNTQDFPSSPGGHFFYTANPGEQALVDSGAEGHFVRTGRTFNSGGPHPLCRFYGSVSPGPNSHFYTISDAECDGLIAMQQTPIPANTQQWNYEGVAFTGTPPQGDGTCPAGTTAVYRAYNNAYPLSGPKNPWDSAHRLSTNHTDIQQLVTQFGWRDEGVVFCAPI